MSLLNKTVLITRAASQAAELAAAIERRGGTVVFFPTIEITPPDSWDECDRALGRIDEYDGLLFTSVNAVTLFLQRAEALHVPLNGLQQKVIYAVGRRTKREIEQHRLRVAAIPERAAAERLADLLASTGVKGKRFLFPRGNLGREILVEHLQRQGASVEPVIVYQTRRPQPTNLDDVTRMIEEGKIDVVTFTSPSTLRNFASFFSEQLMKQVRTIAVVGPVTASAARALGLETHIIASDSSMEGLAEEIARYYQCQF